MRRAIPPTWQCDGARSLSALRVLQVLRAAAVAGVVSGLPSTIHAVATGRDPLAATRAAASIVEPARDGEGDGDRGDGDHRSIAAGVAVHTAITLGWTAVLAATGVRTVRSGAVAGLAIAALDLGIVGRRFPAIRALPAWPQVADHVVFGAAAAVVLRRR